MRARFQPWIVSAMIGLISGWTSWSAAQDERDVLTVQAVRLGIGGACKAGFWTPIWLDLKAGPNGASGTLEFIIPDGDNVPVIYGDEKSGAVSLGPNHDATLLRYAKIGRENAPIRVRLRDGDRVVWSQELTGLPARLAATQELVVGIGDDLNLKEAIAGTRRSPELSLAVVQTRSAADLPDQWLGYEGVDWVVLAVGDGSHLASLSTAQREALLDWLRLGGRMVISAGSGGEQLAAADSPWKALLPGRLAEVSVLRERTGLEAFTGVDLPWEDDEFQRTRPLVSRLREFEGALVMEETGSGTDKPLVVRAAHGLGAIVFIGLDLGHPGFAKWPGRPKLLASVMGVTARSGNEETEQRRGLTHLGYDDLVGQLRAALDQFPGVALVSFTTVSVLTAAYLLLIGPGDYLVLARLNLPRQTTWVSFALLTAAFVAAAWILGHSTHGDRVRLNQLEFVDVEAKFGVVRGTGWAHLYSPRTAPFTIDFQPLGQDYPLQAAGGVLAWQGLPGTSIGGLASAQRSLVVTTPYRVHEPGPTPGIIGLPVQCASSKSMSLRWWGTATKPPLASLVENIHGALGGELSNPLPVELADCLVAFDDKLYRLGKLAPGQVVDMGSRSWLNLEARITRKTIEGSREISTLWQRDSTDLPRLVQILTFHEAARGRNYTGLTHRYQPYLDLSGHLKLNRAVLVGRSAAPTSRLTQAGSDLAAGDETSSQTWFRVIFPVSVQPSLTSQP